MVFIFDFIICGLVKHGPCKHFLFLFFFASYTLALLYFLSCLFLFCFFYYKGKHIIKKAYCLSQLVDYLCGELLILTFAKEHLAPSFSYPGTIARSMISLLSTVIKRHSLITEPPSLQGRQLKG
ncbi:hypothetical protein AB205_0160340 [Aquarana catesbeiana]|uniref:Uncharacterized protein n=1 Tax=Aquarana catesbeiana TaxID=8400 RepID=A0A2G9RSB6_AQUCT|nr:hypothetical protein AB205_0160340 [Aquarana catesbeiana]